MQPGAHYLDILAKAMDAKVALPTLLLGGVSFGPACYNK